MILPGEPVPSPDSPSGLGMLAGGPRCHHCERELGGECDWGQLVSSRLITYEVWFTAIYLQEHNAGLSSLATYDKRLAEAAKALDVELHPLD